MHTKTLSILAQQKYVIFAQFYMQTDNSTLLLRSEDHFHELQCFYTLLAIS